MSVTDSLLGHRSNSVATLSNQDLDKIWIWLITYTNKATPDDIREDFVKIRKFKEEKRTCNDTSCVNYDKHFDDNCGDHTVDHDPEQCDVYENKEA